VLGFFRENRLEKIGINLEKVGTVTVTLEIGLLGGSEMRAGSQSDVQYVLGNWWGG
jgi:hypothetical protein